MNKLLLNKETAYLIDKMAVDEGVSLSDLMETAGKRSAEIIINEIVPKIKNFNKKIYVICGPGNNGGDGFVVARYLKEEGISIRILSLNSEKELNNVVMQKLKDLDTELENIGEISFSEADVVVDAIFGVGINRPVNKNYVKVFREINKESKLIVSLDIPSGVDTDTGLLMPEAIKADHTITFVYPKLGHYLLPAKKYVGNIHVVDIGIPINVNSKIENGYMFHLNSPDYWISDFKWPAEDDHKYKRGHVLVQSGPESSTGAARLAAISALRIGAGAVTLSSSREALNVNATHLTSVMIKEINNSEEFFNFLDQKKINSLIIGPGCGVNQFTKELTLNALNYKISLILDADAISSFEEESVDFIKALEYSKADVIITPHEGEFNKIFGNLKGSKIERTKSAAIKSKSTVILKGNDTVIASPDGEVIISDKTSPFLATAGSGDVLSGICGGLTAQGMKSFKAACAAQWIHSSIGLIAGPGLIAEDMISIIKDDVPDILMRIYTK